MNEQKLVWFESQFARGTGLTHSEYGLLIAEVRRLQEQVEELTQGYDPAERLPECEQRVVFQCVSGLKTTGVCFEGQWWADGHGALKIKVVRWWNLPEPAKL